MSSDCRTGKPGSVLKWSRLRLDLDLSPGGGDSLFTPRILTFMCIVIHIYIQRSLYINYLVWEV